MATTTTMTMTIETQTYSNGSKSVVCRVENEKIKIDERVKIEKNYG